MDKSRGTYKERSQYSCNYNERVKALAAFYFEAINRSETIAPGCVLITRARRSLVFGNCGLTLSEVSSVERDAVSPRLRKQSLQVAEGSLPPGLVSK